MPREDLQDLVQRRLIDFETGYPVLDDEVVHALQRSELADRTSGLDGHRRAREVAQLGQRPGLDDATLPDDAHPVTQRLDLGEDVAGQQHGVLIAEHLLNAALEHLGHQRVEAGRGFVEEVQLDVRGQRGHDRDLLTVALRVRAAALGRVELEAFDQVVATGTVDPTA